MSAAIMGLITGIRTDPARQSTIATSARWSATGYCCFACCESLNIGDLIRSELMAGSAVLGKETASSREGCECKPQKKFLFHESRNFWLILDVFSYHSGQFELNVRFLFKKDRNGAEEFSRDSVLKFRCQVIAGTGWDNPCGNGSGSAFAGGDYVP